MKPFEKKLLTSARAKVAAGQFLSLSGIELPVYFKYRVQNLLSSTKVLVKNELVYLLTETGPGNLRFNPELVDILATERFYVSQLATTLPETQVLLQQKLEAEKHILKQQESQATQGLFLERLQNYFTGIELLSPSPLIFKGQFFNTPITCLVKNGGWISADIALFAFLKNCQDQKRFPLVIAKKISGILFPVFKELSILGLNLNKVYLPPGISPLLEKIKSHSYPLSGVKYCNQILTMDNGHTQDASPQTIQKDMLEHFLNDTLQNYFVDYHSNFLRSEIKIKGNFLDTVSQFKPVRSSRALIKGYHTQQKLIQELRLNFPGALPKT